MILARTDNALEPGFLHDTRNANLYAVGLSDPRACRWCARLLEWFRHGKLTVMACPHCDGEVAE